MGATSSASDVADRLLPLLAGDRELRWRMWVYTGTPATIHGWSTLAGGKTPANGCRTRVSHSGVTRVRVSGSELRMTRPTSANAPECALVPRSSHNTGKKTLQRGPGVNIAIKTKEHWDLLGS
ncbi:hypothetical protein BDZ89DRAFT_1042347 [Hymenopellis radicata]|nr:hypothetical protein BDZ89DRAFT_1042347 [Hymenopellis radicata]